ncbi:MAG: hypothetical protein C0609_01845 [Deltaproteobacteria bacterium]|nr:MAG: hypothetical protein C0609_01845 [Deltaproteobacteria bacterium]
MRIKLIACPLVLEKLSGRLDGVDVVVEELDIGLHKTPQKLKDALQCAVDETPGDFDAIVLGYGACANAVVGLKAFACPIIVPRVDDCIGIFLGSRRAYRAEMKNNPGTYYLTKGWIDAKQSPFDEFDDMCEQFGRERAGKLMKTMLAHYSRLALIRGEDEEEFDTYRLWAKETAEKFDLTYCELEGSGALLDKIANGPWDDEFVVALPGETIVLESFMDDAVAQNDVCAAGA